MATVCNTCLVNMEKALHSWVEDMHRKHFPTDGHVLHQEALNLYEDVSKGSPEMSGPIHITFITVYCYVFYSIISYYS